MTEAVSCPKCGSPTTASSVRAVNRDGQRVGDSRVIWLLGLAGFVLGTTGCVTIFTFTILLVGLAILVGQTSTGSTGTVVIASLSLACGIAATVYLFVRGDKRWQLASRAYRYACPRCGHQWEIFTGAPSPQTRPRP